MRESPIFALRGGKERGAKKRDNEDENARFFVLRTASKGRFGRQSTQGAQSTECVRGAGFASTGARTILYHKARGDTVGVPTPHSPAAGNRNVGPVEETVAATKQFLKKLSVPRLRK